jgi:hypothetical protein
MSISQVRVHSLTLTQAGAAIHQQYVTKVFGLFVPLLIARVQETHL